MTPLNSPPNSPSVSLIVPVHNADKNFEVCLRHISNAEIFPDELIVVADGEPQSTVHLAQQFGARVITTPDPGGPARARNIGGSAATGDLLLFIDADVAISSDTVGKVKQFFIDHPDYAAVIGSYDEAPGAENFLSQYKNLSHHLVHQYSSKEATTFWGACGGIKRTTFLEIGGFNEGYERPSIEDIELGYRLKDAGEKIRLDKTMQVKHLKHWNMPRLIRSDILDRAVPWSELLLSRGTIPNDLNISLRNRAGVLMSGLLLFLLSAGFWFPPLMVIAVIPAAILLWLHWSFYSFFWRRKSSWFAVRAIFWHWFSFLYSGLSFVWCLIRIILRRPPFRSAQGATHTLKS